MRPIVAGMFCVVVTSCGYAASTRTDRDAVTYLRQATHRFHRAVDVYTDDGAAGNHFVVRARMSNYDDRGMPEAAARAMPAMEEGHAERPHSGATCIRAAFKPAVLEGRPNWGAWYFLNGVQRSGGRNAVPEPNWGRAPGAGLDLTGATRLTFFARGQRGGERVEFFALGVGWSPEPDPRTRQPVRQHDPETKAPFAFPDSSPKVGTSVTLTREWQRYSLDLSGHDLSYVLGGFGWAANAVANGMRGVVFYLDDIRYELSDDAAAARMNEPRFVVSYETAGSGDFDRLMRNSAHTYDNALVLLAFLAAGDTANARVLADAFVEAQSHDRFRPKTRRLLDMYRGSLRNAYQGGDLFEPPGWGEGRTARLPGWYARGESGAERGRWLEDSYSVSLDAGNMAWAMLALLAYHDVAVKSGESRYLRAAKELGNWIERNCRSVGDDGYTGGYNGWEPERESDETTPVEAEYRATEHNIDLYAAFERLFLITGDDVWHERAERALRFVKKMWDDKEGLFWTGTEGAVTNRKVIPLDVQAWAVLAIPDEKLFSRADRAKALAYAEQHMRLGGRGYDYSRRACTGNALQCNDRQGVWYEGTAQMAVAYQQSGQAERAQDLTALLKKAQLPSGAMPASDQDQGLLTGFVRDGVPLRYYKRPHIGATAWLVFAERGVNPYWLGRIDSKPRR